jgi:hypothetical protein
MGQRMDPEGLVSGPIYKFVWKKNSFERGSKFDFPRGTNIFGLTVADIRKQGTCDLVIVDDSERLTIRSADGKSSWTSKGFYGGTSNYYDTKKKEDPNHDPRAPAWRVYIPGRVLIRDLDGDGIKEIIINRNNRSTRFFERARNYTTGEIHSLTWQEGSLDTQWKTREIDGYISDFQVKDVDNDGNEELVVSVTDVGGPGGQNSTGNILFFELF